MSTYDTRPRARRARINAASSRDTLNVRELRYLEYVGMRETPDTPVMIDQPRLARLLGISREATSRMTTRLEREGLLVVVRPRQPDGRLAHARVRLNERWELRKPHG